jgi:antitoxin Phd
MEVKLDSLVPYEKVTTDTDSVFQTVEKNGKVVLLKDNQPVYIIVKYDIDKGFVDRIIDTDISKYTLQEAMKIVLSEAKDNTMHAAALADEIFNRRLYLKKNGDKAQYNQIRARCGRYPDLFITMPGNYIKLRGGVE